MKTLFYFNFIMHYFVYLLYAKTEKKIDKM